ARIAGTGSYLPERIMTNKELEDMVDTSDEWIRDRSGIKRRHIAAEGEKTSDMGLAAAKRAMEAAGIAAANIDLIIVATTTPDKVFPSTACIIQRKLGVKKIPAFDVHAACSGFIYALDVATRFITTGGARNALVIGAETYSRIIDWTDRSTCVLFGDGAGAVVLKAANEAGVLSTHIHSDGEFEELLHVPAGISSGYQHVREEAAFIQMKGNEVFRKAVATLGSIARETLAGNNVKKEDIAWLVPHQANLRIITAAAKKLGLPMERVIVTVDEHANTSSASIPLALDVAVRDGRIRRGDILLLEAFGAGFTWGSALVRY
ncbi:MAG: ketoacyl-ACP synthase III, partial [Gammaproteobacteria bacterium]|nr:ketoacyl-ACP synthase III [Gammaproteobacteria bacterium]